MGQVQSWNNPLKGYKYFKITNETETHYGFKYKTGINTDIHPFNRLQEHDKGGLFHND